jgi:UDP-N-acetylmuramate dehydrogenase
LLDLVGAKELKKGGARVWENHANFIVNDKNGSSSDVLNLMVEMKQKVQNEYNIELVPEIIFLGGKNKKENELWQILNKK